jgi:hypothetical protein
VRIEPVFETTILKCSQLKFGLNRVEYILTYFNAQFKRLGTQHHRVRDGTLGKTGINLSNDSLL